MVHPNVCTEKVYVAEINLTKLLEIKTGKMKYKEISKFPSIKKDIAVVVEKQTKSQDIAKTIKKAGGSNLSSVEIFDVYEGKGILDGMKSLAFSLNFISFEKTLSDEEINPCLEKIIATLEKEYKAVLRS